MKYQHVPFSIFVYLGFFICVQGVFMIDAASCNTNDLQEFVRNGMRGAMAMATAALNGIDSNTASQAQNQLTTWLLGSPGKGDMYVGPMFSILNGVLRLKNEVFAADGDTPNSPLFPDDVKIYCDLRRYKRRKNDLLHVYDSDIGVAIKKINTACEQATLMYTVRPDNGFFQIQICPWYIKYAMSTKNINTNELPDGFFNKLRAVGVNWVANTVYKPIDAFSLTDKVFLHEIMHCRDPPPEDSGAPDYSADDNGPRAWSGYGWKHCREFSTETDPNSDRLPEHNADTWALYGSASLLIQNGGTMNEDGTFTAATPTPGIPTPTPAV